MNTTEELRDQIFEVIAKQIRENNPPETNRTFERLKKAGYSEFVSKQLIGQCLEIELIHILDDGEEFEMERFVKNLKNLPREPFE